MASEDLGAILGASRSPQTALDEGTKIGKKAKPVAPIGKPCRTRKKDFTRRD